MKQEAHTSNRKVKWGRLHVYIEDFKGNVIVDETKKSFANGFIRYVNLTAEGKISTTQGSNTCVTTLQLKLKKKATL